jgi:hypothetical protein
MIRKITALTVILFLTLIALTSPLTTTAQDAPDAWAVKNLVMRTGPGETYASITILPEGTALTLEQRDSSLAWLWGRALDSTAAGWVASEALRFRDGFNAAVLPIPPTNPAYLALLDVPVLPGSISPAMHAVFLRGQQLGKRANVFTKVGDCNTDNPVFLYPFHTGNYNLGPYTDLQATIDYFDGSFGRDSAAGLFGYSSLSVLDPIFADPERCQPGESSVACEYRRAQPSVVVIMFGANDVLGITPQQYADSITTMVESAVDQGIIPVLTTFPWCENDHGWEEALAMNLSTVEIAAAYDVPLINMWRAALPLTNCGFAPNTHHLTQSGMPLSFNGDEQHYGNTMRNFLTLRVLDMLRREVLTVPPGKEMRRER